MPDPAAAAPVALGYAKPPTAWLRRCARSWRVWLLALVVLSGRWWAPPVWHRGALLDYQWRCTAADHRGPTVGLIVAPPSAPQLTSDEVAHGRLRGRRLPAWEGLCRELNVPRTASSIPIYAGTGKGTDGSRWLIVAELDDWGNILVTVVSRAGLWGAIEVKRGIWEMPGSSLRPAPISALNVDADPVAPNHLLVHATFAEAPIEPPSFDLWVQPDIGLLEYRNGPYVSGRMLR